MIRLNVHKKCLTDTQVLRLLEASANGLSANIKLSKIQLSKIVKLRRFLISLLTQFIDAKNLVTKMGCEVSTIGKVLSVAN